MLFSLKDLEKFGVYSEGEEVGTVRAFLIDNFQWIVRYMIASIDGRNVALATHSLEKPDFIKETLALRVSRAMLSASPEVDLSHPFSREYELELHDYYDWPYYWEADDVPNTMPGDLTAVPLIDMELDREEQMDREEQLVPDTGSAREGNEHHLHNTQDIYGLPVIATNDGKNAGKLVDFVVDDRDWHIQYIVIETGDLLTGKKVALAPQWVQEFDDENSRILVDLKSETIQKSPRFSSTVDLTPEYLEELRDYYDNR